MLRIIFVLSFFCQIHLGNLFAQSWRYNDSLATIGWRAIEFNDNFLIATSFVNKVSGISEPGFLVLNQNGERKNSVEIPLTDVGIERVLFNSLHVLNKDSLFCLGVGYNKLDSQTMFVSLLLNDSLKVIHLSFVKIVSEFGIPSRSYAPTVNLHKEGNLNNFYGSYSICSTKLGSDDKPMLTSYSLPCFNIFFRMSVTGEILYLKKAESNFYNKADFPINESVVGMQMLQINSFLIGSLAQGYALINDSFNLIKKLPEYDPEYWAGKRTNPYYVWNNKVFSSEVIEYFENVGNTVNYVYIHHNRLLLRAFNLDGELVTNKLYRPIHARDSAYFIVYENRTLVRSHHANLLNPIVSGIHSSDNKHLFVSYSNTRGIDVFCLDTHLNIVWQKSVPVYSDYNYYNLLASKDGGCLLLGWESFRSNAGAPLPLMAIKLDKNGVLTGGQSLVQSSSQKLKVYPNPINNEIHFETDLNGCYDITIYSILGNQYYQNSFCSKEAIVNASNLPIGVYVYVLKSDTNEIFKGKLVRTE